MATEAWRGANLRDGPIAFEATTVSGKHDLTAFIGHNVLMHGKQAPPTTKATRKTDALVNWQRDGSMNDLREAAAAD